ncbi:FecR domain-containing protein [Methylophilus sp. OH31]|uniref:FecR family protein n=1 Tax=Methylophilus sp. OH31 TaxID=1387312 RepID=UPI000464BFBF|nr:FecR domain-containing protein [Methylophilus sp. OH31]
MIHRKHEEMIRQTAARWYMRMREAAPDAPERTMFEVWLLSDRRHSAAYQMIESTMDDFSSTERLQALSNALLQTQYFEQNTRRKKVTKLGSGLAVMLLCLGLGFLGRSQYQQWQASPLSSEVQTTAVAQMVKRTLDDGSVVTANANSAMEIVFYRHQRLVKLTRGEAIFEVTKDPKRPFVVETQQAKVTVLGTRFAVNQLSNKVRISVDHGRVQVARADGREPALILHNGEVAEIEQMASPHKVNRNADDSFSFISGRIVFDRADMFEVADTLSRYRNPTVKAVFFGNQTPKVNAVLKVAEVESFIQTLPQSVPVMLKRTDDALVIEPNR